MGSSPHCFSDSEREILLALAQAAIPNGKLLPGVTSEAIERLDQFLGEKSPAVIQGIRGLIWAVEMGTIPRYRSRFRQLSPEERLSFLMRLHHGSYLGRTLLRILMVPLKVSHFSDPEIFRLIGCEHTQPEIHETPPAWMRRVVSCADLEQDETVDAEIVVVGTGAGGAVVAKELAVKGHAVVMLEEGRYFTRKDFTGTRVQQTDKLYRHMGLLTSVGNVPMLLPLGCCVGGSTTINSGTCYRIPGWVLQQWRVHHGLTGFTEDHLEPYYRRVEATLQVEAVRPEVLGGMARVAARGCERLGWRHGPLKRNAPDCEGKGLCCFGCPTGAKRSTDISYVPLALKQGALLYTGARVERVLTERNRAVGVRAVCQQADGHSRRLTVRAPVVVVACGTLLTPLLLRRSRCCTGSPALGRNLSLHPATSALARFDEPIEGWNGVPQGYAVEEFHRAGILVEGGFTPLDYAALTVPLIGPVFTELMENYGRIANFGFFIHDTSRGRVKAGLAGRPLVLYNLNRQDLALLHRALVRLCELYLAAGATKVFPMVHGFDELGSPEEIESLRRARLRPYDLDLVSFHPLGTARMGCDPATSVVDTDHETHEVNNLFIADGSVVPTPLAVNPQIAIMTLATRAADRIARRLAESSG